MGNLTTAVVGTTPAVIYGAPGSSQGITVLNLDTDHTVWLGYSASIAASTGGGGIPVEPLASMQLDGTASVYAVAEQQLEVGIGPGVTNYSPGQLAISGPVTADITGPVTVEGSVGITGTPSVGISGTVDVVFPAAQDVLITNTSVPTTVSNTVNTSVTNTVATSVSNNVSVQNAAGSSLTVAGAVNVANTPSVTVSGTPAVTVASGTVAIGNTPAVTVSGTPNVAISSGNINATLTGTSNVNVANASIDVVGSGGFVLPGQVSQLTIQTSIAIANGASAVYSLGNVTTYQSLDLIINAGSGFTATGAAYCALVTVQFYDTTNTYILSTTTFGVPLGGTSSCSVPVYGAFATVTIANQGTATGTSGTINITAMGIWGSYRNLAEFAWTSFSTPSTPVADSTITWAAPNPPAGKVGKWISAGSYTPTSTTLLQGIILPPAKGMVDGFFQSSGTVAFSNNPVVVDLTFQLRGSIIPGTGNNGVLMNMSGGASQPVTMFSQIFPACIPALLLKSTSASSVFQFTAVEQ